MPTLPTGSAIRTRSPVYERDVSLRKMLRTLDTCHLPPRAVRTPRRFKASAHPRRSLTPAARSESMIRQHVSCEGIDLPN